MTLKRSPFSSRSRYEQVTICPCCGVKFAGDFSNGCVSCGARSVGEPLPKPEHELPSYGRALILCVMGSLITLAFVVQLIGALVQRVPRSYGFSSWDIAAQTAAWRLKWVAIPVSFLVVFFGRRIYRSILREPSRFCGIAYARAGLTASTVVVLLIAQFIGVSIPTRLHNRELAREAADNARIYRLDRALLEYAARFKTIPSDYEQDLKLLPDPDGSLAEALRELGPGVYKTSGPDLAVLPKQKSRSLRVAVIRTASIDSSAEESLPISFTNYELRLPGPDKVMGTSDDLIVRDGLITRASEAGPGVIGSTASSNALKP
jgi:hypothetical protein